MSAIPPSPKRSATSADPGVKTMLLYAHDKVKDAGFDAGLAYLREHLAANLIDDVSAERIVLHFAEKYRPEPCQIDRDAVPERLRPYDRWVVWNWSWKGNKWDKPPLNPDTGRNASSTNAATWGTFEEAWSAYQRDGYDGIGFTLGKDEQTGENFAGLDLDDCRDADGNIEPAALFLAQSLDSYAEVSPSQTGIKVFVIGSLPADKGRKADHERGIEFYDGGRYFTVTGQRCEWAPAGVGERQQQFEYVYRTAFPPEAKSWAAGTATADVSDIEKLEAAVKGLNARRAHGYSDWLAVGMAIHAVDSSETGLALWLEFSQRCAEKYDEAACRKKWAGFNRSGKLGLGSIVYWAKQDGWTPTWGRNGKATRTTASSGKGKGTSKREGKANPVPAGDRHLTDLGNAQRLVAAHGQDMKYIRVQKQWYVWDGKRFADDVTGGAERRAKATVKAMFDEAATEFREAAAALKICEDEQQKAALKDKAEAATRKLKHALASEGAKQLRSILDVAWSEPGISITTDSLDCGRYLFNCNTGTYDLEAQQHRPHCRDDLLTKLAAVDYDLRAVCPLWLRCLDQWMGNKQHLVEYLQRVVGYCLSANVSEQCFWIFHGAGANGKSTFILTILALMGDYGMQAVSDLLLQKKNESHPTERADLFGKRFVAVIETDEGKRMAEALMKQVTGGDKIRARKLFKDHFEFDPSHKIVMGVNHKPELRGRDHGTWRRPKLVPWTVTIPAAAKDKHLLDKLKAELPGILAWAIRGFVDWKAGGMREPPEVTAATDDYRREMDTIQAFLAECCATGDANYRCKVSALHDAYVDWSGDEFMTQKAFGKVLEEKGYATAPRTKTGVFWIGIGLNG